MTADGSVGETDNRPSQPSPAEDAMLVGRNVSVAYGTVAALRGVSFHVDHGEVVGIIGPNGAGKSTLADAMTGFQSYSGSITYRGQEVREQTPADLVADGFIHCSEKRDLFGFMSVRQNLRMGAYRRGWKDIDDRLQDVYDLFPILEDRTGQVAHTLSGGEQQMLAIGRSLMGRPDLLLLDEPTLGLAPIVLENIGDALAEITAEGMTMVLCEQNVTFTMNHADRIYLLENGDIVREGTPAELEGDEYVKDVYLGQ